MRPPNLLFLMADQQRADTIKPTSPCQTPHLSALAETGVRFERCYAPNPICSPTRASLMTGLLPHSHGMVDCTHTVPPFRAALLPNLPFWSRTLHEAGYRTAYFGKWHIERTNRLENFGFDTYELISPFEVTEAGYRKADNAGYRAHRRQLGVDETRRPMLMQRVVQQKGYRDLLLYGITDEPAEATREFYLYSRAIEFLRQVAGDPERPWLLFVSTEGPHDPYVVPREYYTRYDPTEILRPPSFEDDLSDRPDIYRRIQQVWRQLKWSGFAQATACYYAFCSLIDDQVGRILAALRELGQEDNTLIVYVSDHGDYMGAHRLMLKGVPAFEEAYRVPLIMQGPGIPTGREIQQIVSLLDLAPTLVELTTGGTFECQGRSLLPLLQSEQPQWGAEAFAEMHGQRFFYTQRTLWRGQHKYVFNAFAGDELYDLAADPHEMRNLAHDTALGTMAEEMAARMWEIMRHTGDFNMYQAQDGMYRYVPVGPE